MNGVIVTVVSALILIVSYSSRPLPAFVQPL